MYFPSRSRFGEAPQYLRAPLVARLVTNIMSTNKRIKIYTVEDVQSHQSPSSCWVTRCGKVYDVSAFLPDHPGGDDIILKYAGQDIKEAMKDPGEHDHSDSAYDMMEEYVIGRLGNNANIVDESGLTELYLGGQLLTLLYRLGGPG
jgi:cytochrome b involved in lipid metabolism